MLVFGTERPWSSLAALHRSGRRRLAPRAHDPLIAASAKQLAARLAVNTSRAAMPTGVAADSAGDAVEPAASVCGRFWARVSCRRASAPSCSISRRQWCGRAQFSDRAARRVRRAAVILPLSPGGVLPPHARPARRRGAKRRPFSSLLAWKRGRQPSWRGIRTNYAMNRVVRRRLDERRRSASTAQLSLLCRPPVCN